MGIPNLSVAQPATPVQEAVSQVDIARQDLAPTPSPIPALPPGVVPPEIAPTVQRPEERTRLDSDGNPITAPKVITPTITPTPTPEVLPPSLPHTGPVAIAPAPKSVSPPSARPPTAEATREAQKPDVLAEIKLGNERINNGQQVGVKLKLLAEQAVTGLALVMALPKGVSAVASTLNGAIYDTAKNELRWSNVSLTANDAKTLGFQVTVNATQTPARLIIEARLPRSNSYRAVSRSATLHVAKANAGQSIGPQGGRVSLAGGQIKLDFAPGALKSTQVITGVEFVGNPKGNGKFKIEIGKLGPQAEDERLAEAARIFATQRVAAADVTDATGDDVTDEDSNNAPLAMFSMHPSMNFDTPVQVSIDLNGLVAADRWPVLFYVYYEPQANGDLKRRYERIPADYDEQSGQLTAALAHFSDLQVGTAEISAPSAPKAWELKSNFGDVNLHRGSYEFMYPLSVPPMHDGLQPGLAFKFDSATVDKGDSGYMGMGWSLDLPNISRKLKMESWKDPDGHIHQSALTYTNDFKLSWGGVEFRLVPITRPNSITDTWLANEFMTDPYTPLRVRRCAVGNSTFACSTSDLATVGSNSTGEYWQIWDSNGNRTVLGLSDDSEQVIAASYVPSQTIAARYAGNRSGFITRAWYATRVYALHRDNATAPLSDNAWSARYTYFNPSITPGSDSDNDVLPDEIIYGSSKRLDGSSSPLAERNKVKFTVQQGRPGLPEWWQPTLVQVFAGANELQRYEIGYESILGPDGGGGYSPGGNVWFWMPNRFTEKSAGGTVALPATELSYAWRANGGRRLLSDIRNGYGGRKSISYLSTLGPSNGVTNTYSSRVDEINAYVSLDGSTWTADARRSFAYVGPCYNHSSTPTCQMADEFGLWNAALLTHQQVTETNLTPAGVVLGGSHSSFLLGDASCQPYCSYRQLGKPSLVEQLDANLQPSTRMTTTYGSIATRWGASEANFGIFVPLNTFEYPNAAISTTYKYTRLMYDPTNEMKNNGVYGQATHVQSFDSTTEADYYAVPKTLQRTFIRKNANNVYRIIRQEVLAYAYLYQYDYFSFR